MGAWQTLNRTSHQYLNITQLKISNLTFNPLANFDLEHFRKLSAGLMLFEREPPNLLGFDTNH